MTATLFVGCALVALSIPALIYILVISHKPQLVVTSLSAALFVTAAIYVAAPIPTLLTQTYFAIPMQFYRVLLILLTNISRIAFVLLYCRAERAFSAVDMNALLFPMTDVYTGLAVGTTYALCIIIYTYAPLLSVAYGLDGGIFISQCSFASTSVLGAVEAFALGPLEIALTIITLDGVRLGNFVQCIFVILIAWTAGIIQLMTTPKSALDFNDACIVSAPLLYALTGIGIFWAMVIVNRPNYRSMKQQ